MCATDLPKSGSDDMSALAIYDASIAISTPFVGDSFSCWKEQTSDSFMSLPDDLVAVAVAI